MSLKHLLSSLKIEMHILTLLILHWSFNVQQQVINNLT